MPRETLFVTCKRLMPRLVLTLICCLWAGSSLAALGTIATSSNFKRAMVDLIEEFERSHPHQLRQVNASSGVLFNQITMGAPFDVMLSANSYYPQQLVSLGFAPPESRFTYAEGKLVLAFSKNNSSIRCSFVNGHTVSTADRECFVAAITGIHQRHSRLAVANPDFAPYGIATRQTLQHLGLWESTSQQRVTGSNVGQTYQFVATGNSAAGFVALSQLVQAADQRGQSLDYWPVPESWYQPIRQQAILLQSGLDNPAALSFLAFLQTDRAKAIIQRHGYATR